jgi:hypothetical protein
MTITTECRRITLHLSQIFLTLGWTFIALSWCRASRPRVARWLKDPSDHRDQAATGRIDYL